MELHDIIPIKNLVAAIVYSALGVLTYTVYFLLLDWLKPRFAVWEELVEKQNVAVAIFLGAIAYGIATIIAAAIHG